MYLSLNWYIQYIEIRSAIISAKAIKIIKMRSLKSMITSLVSSILLQQEARAECTFDQPTSPLELSTPYYYHVVPEDAQDQVFLEATVRSNNDCD